MLPDGSKRRIAFLKLKGSSLGALLKSLVHFGLAAGGRVDVFQLTDGKWWLRRILSGVILIKINQIRLTVTQFLDNESHLQTPVTQMYVTNHIVA